MIADGIGTMVAAQPTYSAPTMTGYGPGLAYSASTPGFWGYPSAQLHPYGFGVPAAFPTSAFGITPVPVADFGAPMFDPRIGLLSRMHDPRISASPVPYDPRFLYDPWLAYTHAAMFHPGLTVDPRLRYPTGALDPRFIGLPLPPIDPGYGSWAQAYHPGLMYPGQTGWTGPGIGQPASGLATGNVFPFGQAQGFFDHAPSYASTATGLGGQQQWPGAYGPQQRLTRLPTDEEIEELIHNMMDHDPFIPLDADIEVRCEGGQVTLTGTVPDKRIKRAAGEDAWWNPGVVDVNNTITVAGRRQAQATRRRRRQEPTPASR